ncbi:hypothetical protein KW797_03955, partial [Candidatus Parcubacteria bacterium]|nr:hypothetical protein [Candidatus Parcubacteria bacterium]
MIAKIMMVLGILVTAFAGASFGAESRLRDGKVEFSVSNVNGEAAWTKEEKQNLIDKYADFASTSPIAVIDDSPTKAEIVISTSASYKNYSEFKSALDGKVSDDTILLFKQKIDVAKELG